MSFGRSSRILDTIKIDGDVNENMRSIRDNMDVLQGQLLGQSAQILGSAALSAIYTATTSFAIAGNLTFGITTSGGLLVLVANLSTTTENSYGKARITIDGVAKKTIAFGSTGVTDDQKPLTIFYAEQVPAGKHTVSVEAQNASAGTYNKILASGTEDSTLWALEFLI